MHGFGIRSVQGKSPPKAIDGHTTLDDLYEDVPTHSRAFAGRHHLAPTGSEAHADQTLGEYSTMLRNQTFLRSVRSDGESLESPQEAPEKRTGRIDGFLSAMKRVFFTESELRWVNQVIEQDGSGADVISIEKLRGHLGVDTTGTEASRQEIPSEASPPPPQSPQSPQARPLQTICFVPWSATYSPFRITRRFTTRTSTLVSRPNTRVSAPDDGRHLAHHDQRRHAFHSHTDGKPKEAADRPGFLGFQTAADALAEANTRMGIKPAGKRQGLSKIMYNPPFARPEAPAKEEARHQSPQKKKAKTEEASGLEDVPAYLLNAEGTALLPRVASCEPKLLEAVCREIMDLQTKVAWEDIAGLKAAKDTLEEVIIWPLLRPDIFTGLRGPPKGILLFGPPGTGKTLLARAVASQTGCTFFNISSSSLMSKWIGDGEKMVRCLFAIASVKQPSVVFIDEIDSLLSARTEGEQDAVRRIKTEFLVQLDGAATENTDRVLVIGATNRPEELDEAARRRLERRLYIALPDAASRGQIISRLLRTEAHLLGEEGLGRIVELTEGYSGADMKVLCREAAMRPLRECRSLKSVAVNDVRPINVEDFEKAVKTIRPTVSDVEIQRYMDWNSTFGSASL